MTTPGNEQSLQGLIERVRAATGPDRELEIAIGTTIGGWTYQPHVPHCFKWNDGQRDRPNGPPSYTASIDAALSLVERVLPEHDWILGHTNGGLTIHCQLGPDADKMAFGETPALAILLALLSALKDAS